MSWICDSCGEEISRVEDGWVEWLVRTNSEGLQQSAFGIRIVHSYPATEHHSCQYDESVEYKRHGALLLDGCLSRFISQDGLMELLCLISDDKFEDREEVLEIIKRLHIPGYEKARFFFDEAIKNGVFEPNRKPGYYLAQDIEAVLAYIQKVQR